MSFKTDLLELLHEAKTEERNFVAGLTADQHAEVGTLQCWSGKDTVAHVTFWNENLRKRLAANEQGEPPPDFSNGDQLNDEAFALRHDLTWDQVTANFDEALAVLTAWTEAFPEDRLTDPNDAFARSGNPVWASLIGNAWEHATTHFADYYRQRGDIDRASRMYEAAIERAGKLGGGRARGTSLYNMACFYATTHQTAKALSTLAEALRLTPDLTDWSKEDADLLSLHDAPEYKALYTN